jgi:tetratricopeptide (TPR) repeat protein
MLQTPDPTNAFEWNNRAVELGQRGLWPDAIQDHTQALLLEPGNKQYRTNLSGAHLRYANQLFGQGKTYEAIKQFRSALYVDPDNMPADEGLDASFSKLHKNPLDLKFRESLGEDLDVKGQYEDAIVEFRKCVKMNDSGKSHANLGYVLLKAGKPVDGYLELRTAVSKPWENSEKNDLASVHRKLGDILTEYAFTAKNQGRGTVGMKRLSNAAIEYRRAITLNPSDATALQSFVDVTREGCNIRPTFDNHLMLGGAYLLAGDFSHAKLEYEQCFKIDPRRTELGPARIAFHQAVARSPLSSAELVAESVGKVNRMLQDDPDNARLWYIAGRLKQHQDDRDGAVDAYHRAQKLNHLIDPDLDVQCRLLEGGGRVASSTVPGQGSPTGAPGQPPGQPQGRTPQNPANPQANPDQGQPPAQPDKPAIDPKNLETYSKVEQLMDSDPEQAKQLLQQLLDKNPGDGHAYLLRGNILRKQGQLDQSASDFRMADGLKEPGADAALNMVDTLRVQSNIKSAEQASAQGDWSKAAEDLGDAIIKAPHLPALHRQLSDVYLKLHDEKSAARELKKAQDLEKGSK